MWPIEMQSLRLSSWHRANMRRKVYIVQTF
jgi:hypothetical protein